MLTTGTIEDTGSYDSVCVFTRLNLEVEWVSYQKTGIDITSSLRISRSYDALK